MPLYARGFTLQNLSQYAIGAPTTGPSPAYKYTREPGFIASFEVRTERYCYIYLTEKRKTEVVMGSQRLLKYVAVTCTDARTDARTYTLKTHTQTLHTYIYMFTKSRPTRHQNSLCVYPRTFLAIHCTAYTYCTFRQPRCRVF